MKWNEDFWRGVDHHLNNQKVDLSQSAGLLIALGLLALVAPSLGRFLLTVGTMILVIIPFYVYDRILTGRIQRRRNLRGGQSDRSKE